VDQDKRRTLDDVRRCAGKLPLPAVLYLLNGYKATRISEVPETAYVDFVDRCELMVSTAEMTYPDSTVADLGSICRLP
jgi:hypothetical protein